MSSISVLTKEEISDISNALLNARSSGVALKEFPGTRPASLEDAYKVQTRSIEHYQQEVIGWKIGLIPPAFRETLKADRLVGPIFTDNFNYLGRRHHPTERLDMPVFSGGFAAIEAEFVVETAVDIHPGQVSSDTDIKSLVANLYTGIEIASSPVADLNSYGPTCIVSDFGNNNGLIVGEKIPDWKSKPLSELTASVNINGQIVGQRTAESLPGGPLGAFHFLIEVCSQRGISLPAGSFISTGAVTGVHETITGAKSTADFGEFGEIHIELIGVS